MWERETEYVYIQIIRIWSQLNRDTIHRLSRRVL